MTHRFLHQRPALTGLLVWGICALIGAGVLWIGVTYTNEQRDAALSASLDRQHVSLINGCIRGNKLRVRLNNTIRIEHDFLVAARAARLAAVKTAYIQQLVAIPLVNCEEAYPR